MSERHPHYSVLIPSYNHAEYLEAAVRSASEELSGEIEILILDDGSTDSTPELLDELQSLPGVHTSRQENSGADQTLNRLLQQARGAYCAILNSDDLFLPGHLQKLSEKLEESPDAVISASWIRIIDGAGREIGLKRAWENLEPWPRASVGPMLEDLDNPTLALLQSNWVSTTSNMLFRREDILKRKLRFRSLRYCHDWDFLLSAAHFGTIALVPEALVAYRVHGANTIAEGGVEKGQARMRWEILWTVARHATALLRRHPIGEDLRPRLLRSLPDFGRRDLLFELLALRGTAEIPPRAYDAALQPGHPLREAALKIL